MTKKLQYPLDLSPGLTEHITFTSHAYRPNKSEVGMQHGEGEAPSEGAAIVLYMPTTTPAVTQHAKWSDQSFSGPMGELLKSAAILGGSAINTVEISGNFDEMKSQGRKAIDGIKNTFEKHGKNIVPAIRQAGVGMAAKVGNMNANQLMALTKGQIYNPNVELLYEGPKIRSFNFTFTMVPKSAEEARAVNNIILEFKKWAAPELLGTGMYRVPHVWQIKYMNGAAVNKNMNAFKRAALTNVSVQNNQGLNMHMSFEDGMPIVTTISLAFVEVDVITRNDHLDGKSFVGY